MSAKEYKTSTLVSEIRSRGIVVATFGRDDAWWLSGHAWRWSQCHDWIEAHQAGLRKAMTEAATDYYKKHANEMKPKELSKFSGPEPVFRPEAYDISEDGAGCELEPEEE